MMNKLFMSVYKEFLLLKRDFGGVIILFVMPLVLIITVTLIQDSTYQSISESKIPVLLLDNDKGEVAKSVITNLENSALFTVVQQADNSILTENQVQDLVFRGKYKMGIILPSNLSSDLHNQIELNVNQIMSGFGLGDSLKSSAKTSGSLKKEVKLYFDPAVQLSFKASVMNSIDKMISQIETHSIYSAFQNQLGQDNFKFEQQNFIAFKEIIPRVENREIIPNSVQHNVPAWTLFAIFFIVIPLSINIVKEKSLGTSVRLRTNPVSNFIVLSGKTITYLAICMIQFYMMVGVAIFLFPHLGLPSLNISGNLFMMSIVALFSGLAAIGFGILLGTLSKTQEQSAPFGATSVIILAAIGGVWVPVFAMPKIMQIIAQSSPMNWALNAFYDVLLRQASFTDILSNLALLFLFFIITITLALLFEFKKRAV